MLKKNMMKKTRTTVRHWVNSPKNDQVIRCESNLERDLVMLLEFSPNVASFKEQPETFGIPAEPKAFSTTPDFAVTLVDGSVEQIEVKYRKKAEQLTEKFEAVRRHLESLGFAYRVFTELEIRRSQMVLHNCQYLKPFKLTDLKAVEQLRELVPDKSLTFGQLIQRVDKTKAMQMVAHQLIFHDFNTHLSSKSHLRLERLGDFDYLYPKQ